MSIVQTSADVKTVLGVDGVPVGDRLDICCSSDMLDLFDIYCDYPPLWVPSAQHYVYDVRSQMNPCAWRTMLCGGMDSVFGVGKMDIDSHFLLDGMMHGFKLINPTANIVGYDSKNYVSATVSARVEIDKIITEEIEAGKLSICDEDPVCIHALGAVPKASGGFRPITDASRPSGSSINCHMEDTFKTFRYKSVDMVANALQKNWFMSVTDIGAAYRSILIRPSDRTYQGLRWEVEGEDLPLIDNFLSFGTRVAPCVFSRITDSIARFMEASGYRCWNYLDDFLVMGATFDECRRGQLLLHKTLRELGFYIAYKKVKSPAQIQIYLGVEINSCEMSLRLPDEKVERLYTELAFFAGRSRATKKQLQRLCGILAHCATLVRGGRTFSHRIIEMLGRFSSSRRFLTLSKCFKADLDWWVTFSKWFNGSAKIIQPMSGATQVLHTDSSGSGFGAVSAGDWFCGAWDTDISVSGDSHNHCVARPAMYIPDNINVRELYPILEAIWRWGSSWRNCQVQCYSDNTQVVAAINSGKSSNSVAMDLLRQLFWQSVLCNCHLVSLHLSGSKNVIADSLSRVSTGAVIPEHLCCRGGVAEAETGSTGGRDKGDGMGPLYMEDKGEPVEKIHKILYLGHVPSGASGS